MLYFDNAATSWPKAPGVSDAMKYYIDKIGVNINRGVYAPAQEAGLKALTLREQLAAFFHHPDPDHVIFTSGCTAALNLALKGFLRPGDHVLVSSLEHNAVMRPLVQLGVDFDRVPCDKEGFLRLDLIEPLLRPNTRLFVLNHASNVSGSVQDAEAVGKLCKLHQIALLLDGAQSAGHVPVDFERFGLSALAVPAHKGLLGPQGTGLLLCRNGGEPLLRGGTGSDSINQDMPADLPERLEAGTMNVPGFAGLTEGMWCLLRRGTEDIFRREHAQLRLAAEGLKKLGLEVFAGEHQAGTLSFRAGMDCEDAAAALAKQGIAVRAGLHCAPLAHESAGTLDTGTVRISFGIDACFAQTRALLQGVSKGVCRKS